jgi:Helicase HerA, central domain/TraM recognition site of TraD and TraG
MWCKYLDLPNNNEATAFFGDACVVEQVFKNTETTTILIKFFVSRYLIQWKKAFESLIDGDAKEDLINSYYVVSSDQFMSLFDNGIEAKIQEREGEKNTYLVYTAKQIDKLHQKVRAVSTKIETLTQLINDPYSYYEYERGYRERRREQEAYKIQLYDDIDTLETRHTRTYNRQFSRSDIPLYDILGIMSASDRAIFIAKYTPNTMGYIQFLRDYFPFIFKALSKPLSLRIPEPELRKHAYITGRTGSGKTELLKSILYDKIEQKRSAIVVLDPNGDFGKDIATFRNLHEQDRLVYIDPVAFPDATPVFNPFEVTDTSIESLDVSAQTLTQSIRESVKEGRLSNQMEVLLYPVIATLLQKGNTDMKELQQFMDATSSDYLYKLGLKSRFENHRDFFRTQFDTRTYDVTKASIKTRIQSLLNSYIFSRLIDGKSSFDLESLIEQRKVIVFNLAKGKMGVEASAAYGRLILSTLQAIAYRRVNKDPAKRVTTYIAIDEFQNYITPSIESILTEARKYGLHLIFASQVSGQNMDASLKKIALSCTNIKIVGANSRTAHEEIAGEVGIHANDLQTLGTGDFIAKIGNSPPVRFRGTSELVKKSPKYYVSDTEWNDILSVQKARYYREFTAHTEGKQATEAVNTRKRKYDDGLRPDL